MKWGEMSQLTVAAHDFPDASHRTAVPRMASPAFLFYLGAPEGSHTPSERITSHDVRHEA